MICNFANLETAMMQNNFQDSVRAGLFCLSIALAMAPGPASAQSGSTGGSIGNDEKSISGSREAPRSVESDRPARRSRTEPEETHRAARKSGGGGGGNFDGAWVVVGVGTTCSGSSTTAVVVSSGNIIGEGVVSGHVSPSGAASAVGTASGITINSVGRLSGRSGSGTFRRSDGCVGRWTASKQ
jgi:hypothetical protein